MPSGGNSPLGEGEMKLIFQDYIAACKEGLDYEWLQWMLGGIAINHLSPLEASRNARIEWDI